MVEVLMSSRGLRVKRGLNLNLSWLIISLFDRILIIASDDRQKTWTCFIHLNKVIRHSFNRGLISFLFQRIQQGRQTATKGQGGS